MSRSGIIAAIVVGLIVVLKSSIFVVNEKEQAVITKFGQIVGDPIVEAGIKFKTPFVHDVNYFEKRILHWDGDPAQVPTKDKKFILIDTTARWKIVDPVQFFKTVRNINLASRRITGILDGKTKNVVSNYNLVEAVRNTNAILDKINDLNQKGEADDNITGDIESITAGREELAKLITKAAQDDVKSLGIELLDVLITRIAYVREVEAKVFDRMISERNRIAEKIRSVGKGEVAKIQGKLNLDLKKIESEAYKKAESIKGMADGTAIKIYAQSLGQDPDFYEFSRTLEAYKKTIPQTNQLILGTESDFFRLIDKSK